MAILIYVLIFLLGIVASFFFHILLGRRRSYSGTIYVIKTEEKTVYSLELSDHPETLEFKDEVVFKVDTSEKSPDRN